jgi:WD domain, G-beta repeat
MKHFDAFTIDFDSCRSELAALRDVLERFEAATLKEREHVLDFFSKNRNIAALAGHFMPGIVSVELRTLTGHSGPVISVAIAPDGRTALSGSRGKTLKLWDLASGKEQRTFAGHTRVRREWTFRRASLSSRTRPRAPFDSREFASRNCRERTESPVPMPVKNRNCKASDIALGPQRVLRNWSRITYGVDRERAAERHEERSHAERGNEGSLRPALLLPRLVPKRDTLAHGFLKNELGGCLGNAVVHGHLGRAACLLVAVEIEAGAAPAATGPSGL